MPYFDAMDRVSLYFEECGEGFPLIFLHPWPADHAIWSFFQVPIFSRKYRVITPDSRGLGKSGKPEFQGDSYSLKRLSDDVDELLARLGIRRAFVVGHSLGGAVAQKFALDHGDKVQAAVWIGAPTFPLDELTMEHEGRQLSFVDVYTNALRAGGYSHFWDTIWKPAMSYQFHESFAKTYIGSYLIRYLFEKRYADLDADPSGAIGLLEGIRHEESLERSLAKMELPSAIVAGEGDDSLPLCERQHRAIPRAEYFVIKNSAHFCFMDQPEMFNTWLDQFLIKHAPSS